MSVKSFIPQVWSARLLDTLHKNLVFGSLCNRHWEGDITQWGDTVHINALSDITVRPYTPNTDIADPEQLAGTDLTLTIDHGAYFNFYLNDVDAAQARPDLMEAAMRNAAVRLAEDMEDYVLGVIRDGAGVKQTMTLDENGIYGALVALKTLLDEKNMPRAGRCLIVPASVEGKLLLDDRFVTGTAEGGKRLAEGSVARAAGFDIYISNDLSNEMVAMNSDAVTLASQILKTEAYRREKGFDDGVKGLSVCGAKVVQPECVSVITLEDGE